MTSTWSVNFHTHIIRWSEQNAIGRSAQIIEFTQAEGDFANFSGSWQGREGLTGGTSSLSVEFGLEIHSLAPILAPVAQRAQRQPPACPVRSVSGPADLTQAERSGASTHYISQHSVSIKSYQQPSLSHRDPAEVYFRSLRSALQTRVLMLTTVDAVGEQCGVTVSGTTSLSLRPLTVLVCLSQESGTLAVLPVYRLFALNMLRANQAGVARQFAQGRQPKARCSGLGCTPVERRPHSTRPLHC